MVDTNPPGDVPGRGRGPASLAVHRIVVPPDVADGRPARRRATSSSRAIERAFPRRHPRPRQRDHADRPAGEVALVERLIDELVAVIGTGQGLTAEAVERAIAMLAPADRPSARPTS